MDIKRIREDGAVALAIALGILVLTAALSFWRLHVDEKEAKAETGDDWNRCVENCMEGK